MTHKKVLEILAWLFSIAAIISIIYTSCTNSGVSLCTFLLTLALILQFIYAKETKRNEKQN